MHTNTDYAALVGLDWGDTTHAFAVLSAGERQPECGTVSSTPEALHAWLEQLGRRHGGQPIALAIEAGRNSLLHALLEYPWLTVYPVHPATSARFRRAFTPSGAKDDGPDALTVLELLRQHQDKLTALVLDTPATRELATLVEARRGAVDARTRLVNQLTALLKRVFPQALVLAGEDLAAPLAMTFLRRFPSLRAVRTAGPSRLRAFYRQHNVRSVARIEERLALLVVARPITDDEAVLRPAALELNRLLDLLTTEAGHIDAYDHAISAAFAAHPLAELFAALPGAGRILAPRLLVACGDRPERYPCAHTLQKYAGIAPVREKSGRQIWTHWRWAAPKFVRQTFVEWAGQTVPRCAWAKAFYLRQKSAGKGHHAILRSLAFKWLRILWRCWKDNVPYDEARYLAALTRRAPPLSHAS